MFLFARTGPDEVGPGVGAVVGTSVVGAGLEVAGGGVPAQVAVTPPLAGAGATGPGAADAGIAGGVVAGVGSGGGAIWAGKEKLCFW